jgi:hypothetical protein
MPSHAKEQEGEQSDGERVDRVFVARLEQRVVEERRSEEREQEDTGAGWKLELDENPPAEVEREQQCHRRCDADRGLAERRAEDGVRTGDRVGRFGDRIEREVEVGRAELIRAAVDRLAYQTAQEVVVEPAVVRDSERGEGDESEHVEAERDEHRPDEKAAIRRRLEHGCIELRRQAPKPNAPSRFLLLRRGLGGREPGGLL